MSADRSRDAFDELSDSQRLAAVANLRREGHSIDTIATATRLSREAVLQMLRPPEIDVSPKP